MSSSSEQLTNIRDLFQRDSRLSSFKTFKRGIFYPSAVFPVLAILPMAQRVHKIFTNNLYYYARQYSLQLYIKGLNVKEIKNEIINLAEVCKMVMQEYTKKYNYERIYNISFGATNFSGTEVVGSEFVGIVTQDFTMFSHEDRPTIRDRVALTLDTKINTLGEKLFSLIERATKGGYGRLHKLKSVHYPIAAILSDMEFPSVAIVPVTDTKDRYAQQLDNSENAFQIQLWSKVSDKELNLLYLLDLADDLRSLLYKISTLKDLCWKMDFNGISFQYISDEDTMQAYMAMFDIVFHVFENSRRGV